MTRSRKTSSTFAPPPTRTMRRSPSSCDGVDPRDVGDDPAGDVRVAGEGMAPAAAGHRPPAGAGEAHDLADVSGALAERDRARRDVQARVVERARRGPAGIARGDERAAQPAAQLGGRRGGRRRGSQQQRGRTRRNERRRAAAAHELAPRVPSAHGRRTIWAAEGCAARSLLRPRRCPARPPPRARSSRWRRRRRRRQRCPRARTRRRTRPRQRRRRRRRQRRRRRPRQRRRKHPHRHRRRHPRRVAGGIGAAVLHDRRDVDRAAVATLVALALATAGRAGLLCLLNLLVGQRVDADRDLALGGIALPVSGSAWPRSAGCTPSPFVASY